WMEMMKKKVDIIIKAIKENWDKVFVYSDVDIQFFKKTKKTIIEFIKNKDMVIQRNTSYGSLCAGFFAARGNNKNLCIWQDIRKDLDLNRDKHDQDYLNLKLLYLKYVTKNIFRKNNQTESKNKYGIKWSCLPVKFYSPLSNLKMSKALLCGLSASLGLTKGFLWKTGTTLHVPKNIVLHHANSVLTVSDKILQLDYVKNVINKNK
ncbi:MAG: hypothetical protein JSV96_06530, partial [Candidatus Aminicenantes bacterium]